MAATKPRTKPPARRHLVEQVTATGPGPGRVDRDKGVIHGVKVLGRFSRNAHRHPGAVGTEYSVACMDDAVRRRLYEGVKVRTNHPPRVNGRRDPAAERDVHDSIGVLKDVRREPGPDGEPGLFADLHYLKTHPLAESVCEDADRGLGVYGLSHNADSETARERFDPASRRLVIECIADVRSVDLVDRPATNRNLFESLAMPQTTRRAVLESLKPAVTAKRLPWLTWLLEDEHMAADAPAMDAPADDAEPEDKLWAGICDAVMCILDRKKAGEIDAAAAGKAIAKYLKAHDRLTADADPEDEPVEESADDEDDEDDPKKKKPVDESVELAQLRAKDAARTLCESLDFFPTGIQLKAVAALPEAERKPLIESFKAGLRAAPNKPRSGFAPRPPAKPPAAPAGGPADDLAALRG